MGQSFHLALQCRNKRETKLFYKNILGFNIGREGEKWIDVNMHGNQLTFTEISNFTPLFQLYTLESHDLPVFHFGIILNFRTWNHVYNNLYDKGIEVGVEKEFFVNNVGEHTSFFIKDPNGYNIEFKCFKDENEVFRSLRRS